MEKTHPHSITVKMAQGSYLYMASQTGLSGTERRQPLLDHAQEVFASVLQQKAHFGPAHNAIAAVIKQKRFLYLDQYIELEKAIAKTEIRDSLNFFQVFPDVTYYPGERVPKMVWHQLHTGVAYFPFLNRLGREFVIPPLHIDLAENM